MAKEDARERALAGDEVAWIEACAAQAERLYEGRDVGHHSCGVGLAVTFAQDHRHYQSLRKGGLSGERFCGAIRAGELLLGAILGNPDPSAGVSEELRLATAFYQEEIPKRFARGSSPDYICKNLTKPLGEFHGAQRKGFCTNLSAQVAALTAESLVRFGKEVWKELGPSDSEEN